MAGAEMGAAAIRREAGAIGARLGPWATSVGRGSELRLEILASRQADAWLAKAESLGWEYADRHIEQRVRLTGSYETLSSASRERLAATRVIRNPERYVREWSAVLDRRTCRRCSELDGRWVRVDESFPEGEPSQIHGRCRCMSQIVAADWVRLSDAA
jgi:hypothetical protein